MLLTAFASTWKEIGSAWFQRLVIYRQKLMPTNHKLTGGFDKSFADDLVASRYCKHESSLCATICWDFSCVPTICSSSILNFNSATPRTVHFWQSDGSGGRAYFFVGFLSGSEALSRTRLMFTVAILAQGTLSGWSVSLAFFVLGSNPNPVTFQKMSRICGPNSGLSTVRPARRKTQIRGTDEERKVVSCSSKQLLLQRAAEYWFISSAIENRRLRHSGVLVLSMRISPACESRMSQSERLNLALELLRQFIVINLRVCICTLGVFLFRIRVCCSF